MNVSQETFHGIDTLIDRLAGSLDPSRCALYFARVGDVGIGYANDLLHTGSSRSTSPGGSGGHSSSGSPSAARVLVARAVRAVTRAAATGR